jgi:hypothetical protein
MQADAVLITTPRVDFDRLVGIAHQALGFSIAAASDANPKKQTEIEKYLSCLASLKDPKATVTPNLFAHVAFSVLVACDERDILDVMECASGIAFVSTDTVARGIVLAVASGTLSQWRDAVVTGCQREATVRFLFNRIMHQFEAVGLNAWSDYLKKQTGQTFYLEHKR